MSLINDTNRARTEKMLQFLDLIAKSARSNQSTKAEMWELLQPLIDRISEMVGAEETQPEASGPEVAAAQAAAARSQQKPEYITIRDLAQTASLKDLTYAMAVYLSRIDEELNP